MKWNNQDLGRGHDNAKRDALELARLNPNATGQELYDMFYQPERAQGHSWRMDWARRNRKFFDRIATK